jgi:hypothetical protein
MNFNLNDASFDAKEGVAIFNDGVAGIVENVTLSVSKKTAEDKENAPDYKLTFTDSSGATCNTSFWYVKEATAYATVEEQIKKQGTILKHIIHAIYGADYQIPVNATTAQQLLDQSMKIIREGLASGLKFRMFANYGSTQSIKKYIQPRSWVPFLEPMTVAIENTRLEVGKIDAMVRLEADNVGATSGAQGTAVANTDDW